MYIIDFRYFNSIKVQLKQIRNNQLPTASTEISIP